MNKKKKISFITLGCKVNQYETDYMAQSLLDNGYLRTDLTADTDFVIINSCTVTNEADRKTRQMIRRAKRTAPDAKIIVTGCLSQVSPELILPEVDYQAGNRAKTNMPQILESLENAETKAPPVFKKPDAYWLRKKELNMVLKRPGNQTRQYLMVQEGCDRGCTYCKIFHARGTTLNSKAPETVIKEIKDLLARGVQEIVLTGINLGKYQYGQDNLADLIRKIDRIKDSFRIRLSSLDPDHVDAAIVETLKSDKVCPHLHLSIQSGSDSVLSRMNRGYTRSTVLKAVERLRRLNPLFSISCDIITGFPGETLQDFNETITLLEEIEPLKTHIFRYSPKKSTPAANYEHQINGKEKKRRAAQLRNTTLQISKRVRKSHIAGKRSIIVEQFLNGTVHGHDDYYLNHICKTLRAYKPNNKLQAVIKGFPENDMQDEVISVEYEG